MIVQAQQVLIFSQSGPGFNPQRRQIFFLYFCDDFSECVSGFASSFASVTYAG